MKRVKYFINLNVSNYAKPGIYENTTITKIVGSSPGEGKSDFLEITWETPTVEGVDNSESLRNGQLIVDKLYMSEGASPVSYRKLNDIATVLLGSQEPLEAIEAVSIEDYGNQLTAVLANKPARWKFAGIEIEGGEGKQNWLKSVLPFKYFVESMEANPTRLRFDETNPYDVKRLETLEEGDDSSISSTSEDTDLY